MTDIVKRLREDFTVNGDCDFDALIAHPELRDDEMWRSVVVGADAVAEIERLRASIRQADMGRDALRGLLREARNDLQDWCESFPREDIPGEPTLGIMRRIDEALGVTPVQPRCCTKDGGECGLGGYCGECTADQPAALQTMQPAPNSEACSANEPRDAI